MCNLKILLIFFLLITVYFKCTNAFISTLDSNLNDGKMFMGIGGTLFLIWIFVSQTLLIIICGKNRKASRKKQHKNTETDREIATDTIDQKLFKSVEERKAKRRTERRRKVLAAEAGGYSAVKRSGGGHSGSAVKRAGATDAANNNANGSNKSDFDEEEDESPVAAEGGQVGSGTNAAATAARKKKTNATQQTTDEVPFITTEEDGYAIMTPKNWQKT